MDDVPVGSVQFDTIKARLLGIDGRLPELVDDCLRIFNRSGLMGGEFQVVILKRLLGTHCHVSWLTRQLSEFATLSSDSRWCIHWSASCLLFRHVRMGDAAD